MTHTSLGKEPTLQPMPDQEADLRPGDHGARVIDRGAFKMILELEVKKAQRLRYFVSVVCLRVEPSETGAERVTRVLARNIRETDCVTPTDDRSLLMLLVDAEPDNLPVIVERVMGALDVRAWSAGGASYPNTALTTDALLTQAVELQTRAEKHGGDRIYVATGA